MENFENKVNEPISQEVVIKNKLVNNVDNFINNNASYSAEEKEVVKEKIQKTLELALSIHRDQKDRPDGPYVNHIMRVSNRIVEEYGVNDPELVEAALLHDSVEDQAQKLGALASNPELKDERERALLYIKENFGERIEKIVKKLSNPEDEGKELTQDEKNNLYKEHVKEAIEDPDVLPIKLADFSDNALNLGSVNDISRRIKLSRKYLPVMKLFIERLKNAENVFRPEKINEMSQKLQATIEKTTNFIGNFEKIKLLVDEVASVLHDKWRESRKMADGTFEPRLKKTKDQKWIESHTGVLEVDIANTSYGELPTDWQDENKKSAEVAVTQLVNSILNKEQLNDEFIEKASAVIHDKWLERNGAWAPAEQKLPYPELTEEEKEKDRVIIKEALKFSKELI